MADQAGGAPGAQAKGSNAASAFVYLLSLACLLWVYHDFDWKAEWPRLRAIHWAWIVLAVVTDILVYVSQAWRWNLLLRPVARVGLGQSVQSVYIGLFANEVLPLRSGELIRCYLLAIWNKVSFPLVVSSALIERLVDGAWLIAGFFAVSLVTDMPAQLEAGVWVLSALVGGLGALVMFAVFNRRFAIHVTTKHRWSDVLRTLVEGLHDMGRGHYFLLALMASFVYLFLQIVPIYALMAGCGLDVTLSSAAIVLVVLRLGTVVPGPPGNVGVFHFFAFLALNRVLGVDAQVAKGVSAVMFFVITVPLLIAGSVSLALTGLRIHDLLHRARRHHAEHEAAKDRRE